MITTKKHRVAENKKVTKVKFASLSDIRNIQLPKINYFNVFLRFFSDFLEFNETWYCYCETIYYLSRCNYDMALLLKEAFFSRHA